MLTISQKDGESIVIEPAEAIDPTVTVAELLHDWQIEITVVERKNGHTRLERQSAQGDQRKAQGIDAGGGLPERGICRYGGIGCAINS